MVLKKNGFTLIELIIVVTILVVMSVILIGTINPIAQVNKGADAVRKKDINRVKTAFEEFNNDNKCYPTSTQLGQCGKAWESISLWPCDPEDPEVKQYTYVIDSDLCPNWFKIRTKLSNLNDGQIPAGWTNTEYNFGVSSSNVLWNE